MSYIKLGQIANYSEDLKQIGSNYIEDCSGGIIVANTIQYPLVLTVEVIDWESEEDFNKRGKINAFNAEIVNLAEQPINIREAVYQQLLIKYPNLVK